MGMERRNIDGTGRSSPPPIPQTATATPDGKGTTSTGTTKLTELSQPSIRAAPYPNATQRNTLTSLEMGMEGGIRMHMHSPFIHGWLVMKGGGRLFL